MSTSWIHPASRTFVEVLPELTVKGQKLRWLVGWLCAVQLAGEQIPVEFHRTKTHTHHLGLCDVCLEPIWIVSLGKDGVACRMTPKCPGRHRREGFTHQ